MGPHFFKCGKTAGNAAKSAKIISFNGAALFQVRKAQSPFFLRLKTGDASMGPHFFKCGKPGRCYVGQTGDEASMGPHFFKCGKL